MWIGTTDSESEFRFSLRTFRQLGGAGARIINRAQLIVHNQSGWRTFSVRRAERPASSVTTTS